MTAALVILLFVLLIFPHELGHFVAAKACGVQVNEFAFGMGPKILKKQRGETLYSIRLVPIGGFCAMEGEDTEESEDNPRAFNNKKWWQKIIILVAGASMNILIAMIALTILAGVGGMPTNGIEQVTENGPAFSAGIMAGDKITKINGSEINSWADVTNAFSDNIDEKAILSITVERGGETKTFEVTPQKGDDGRYIIGIHSKVSHNIFKAAGTGITGTFKLFGAMFTAIRQMFASGDVLNQVSGPVGVVKIVDDSVQYGFLFYTYIVALISVNLALFNLLPLPALDGGRIIFVIIRKITGRAISDKIEARVHAIGMMLLILLAVIVTGNDILRLIK